MQGGAKRIGREFAVGARQCCDLETAERGMGAAFAGDDMRRLMRQNLVARPAMRKRRRDVAHGPGGHEHGGLLAEQVGHALAQQIYGRIVADLLVADFSPRDSLAHAGRRAGLRIRQQVDADRRLFRIARGRCVDHGKVSYFSGSAILSIQKGPGKTGAFELAQTPIKKSA